MQLFSKRFEYSQIDCPQNRYEIFDSQFVDCNVGFEWTESPLTPIGDPN